MYTDSQGNIYTPSGLFVTAVPTLTGNQTKVLVPGPGGRISVVDISQLVSSTNGTGSSSAAGVRSFNGRTGDVIPENSDYLSDNIKEGQNNRYFTSDRARAAISLTTYGTTGTATYNPITGVINVPQYTVPAETDPIFTASIAAGITNINISNWNSAYGWGNHALAGYVPSTRTITINGTVLDLSADRSWTIPSYTLPTATGSVLGGVKIGSGISISAGVISVSTNYEAPIAAGTTAQYWRGDKTWQSFPIFNQDTTGTAAYSTNARYVYNNGTYGGTVGYIEPSGMYVYYARNSYTSEITNQAQYVQNDATTMRFHWSGQDGQPTWLWGGNSSTDMYVWNPSNFSVNYANSAGYATTAGSATDPTKLPLNGGTITGNLYANGSFLNVAGYMDISGTIYLRSNIMYLNAASTAWNNFAIRNGEGFDLYATAYYENSDIRFKNVIETNPKLDPVSIDVIKFTRKGDTQIRYGYSAQQVRQYIPDAVVGKNNLTVNYADVHTLKIAALERRIAELELKLNESK